jgi:hypothetical protein
MWIDLTDIHETALLNFLRLSYTEVESDLKGDTRMFLLLIYSEQKLFSG